MKIIENISMKSVYTGLDTVRGYMPSADTVKNWTIEPIKSTWSKPAGKAVFIAAGVMATLAIAYTAVKAIKGVFHKRTWRNEIISRTQKDYKNYSSDQLLEKYIEVEKSGTEKEEKRIVLDTINNMLQVAVDKEARLYYAESSLEVLRTALSVAKQEVSENPSDQELQTYQATLEAMIQEKS